MRGHLLIPFLVVFVFLGAFSANNDFADIVVACVFGVLGYSMVLFGWPRAPFVLGLVMGRLAERYLGISLGAYGTGWLLHPPVMVMMVLLLGSVAYSVYKRMRNGDRAVEGRAGRDEEGP